tara:strand:+ start:41 stop:1150 length:1110 start_codon:yes stop_codon:yes gene_type:complete
MLVLAWLLLGAASSSSPPQLYGLTRIRNSPACSGAASGCSQLVRVDAASGTLTNVGTGHQQLAALGDLVTIDAVHRVYYFLADGWNGTGTWLVGLSLDTGAIVQRKAVPQIGEFGIVGGGQSLSLDAARSRLIVSGLHQIDPIANATDYEHIVLTAKLVAHNEPIVFTQIGTFGDSAYMPIAHASQLDDAGTTLYVDLSPSAHSYGIGVVDVSPASPAAKNVLRKVIAMPGGKDQMWGMSFLQTDAAGGGGGGGGGGSLVSVQQNSADYTLNWRTLNPATEAWTSRPLKNAGNFTTIDGNLESIRAFDAASSIVYVLLSIQNQEQYHIGAIDVVTGTLKSFSPPLNGDTGWSGSVLLQMALVPPHHATV